MKHSFRVRCEELSAVYTLQASDEHDKKQWVNAIQDALTKYRTKFPDMVMDNIDFHAVSKRRATYDPSSKKNGKSRQVNRSSSDKSNTSVTSSSDKSSTLDESQDDVSTTSEDATSWGRARSQTVNVLDVKAKAAVTVSRNSSGSSTRSDESSSSGADKEELKLKERLRRSVTDGNAPKSLRASLRKKSLTRHFSLGKGDKTKCLLPIKTDDAGTERQKCQRSRSLNYSPDIVKSLSSRYLSKKLGNKNFSTSSNAAKPPIAPSSPFSERRSSSLRPPETLHQARSTPDLTKIVNDVTFNGVTTTGEVQSNSSSDAKDDLAEIIPGNDVRRSVTYDEKDSVSSVGDVVLQISVSGVEEVPSAYESTEHDNMDASKCFSDVGDMAGPWASSDEASLDTLIATSDSGLDGNSAVDAEQDSGAHSETLKNDWCSDDERDTEDVPDIVTNEIDSEESPITHLLLDDERIAPAECVDDNNCDNTSDEPDAVANAGGESNEAPVVVLVNCNTNSQGDESVECVVQDNERDDKKYCRSEHFEESISTQNTNIQTAT